MSNNSADLSSRMASVSLNFDFVRREQGVEAHRFSLLSPEVRGGCPGLQRGPQTGQFVCRSCPGTDVGADYTTNGE